MFLNFEIGTLLATTQIADDFSRNEKFKDFVLQSFNRYIHCDWGEMSEDDKKLNDEAVKNGDERIFASYTNPNTDVTIWIITEADRSHTTIIYPSEY